MTIMTAIALKDFSWKMMIAAVEDVREGACRLDMLEVGLVDESWYAGLTPVLAARLKDVIAARTAES